MHTPLFALKCTCISTRVYNLHIFHMNGSMIIECTCRESHLVVTIKAYNAYNACLHIGFLLLLECFILQSFDQLNVMFLNKSK